MFYTIWPAFFQFCHKPKRSLHIASNVIAPRLIMLHNPLFPRTGFVRLSSILAPNGPIPVSKSTWWQGVKAGRFPKPQKLGPRTTVWKAEDIRALFDGSVDG
jgi:prophage regulatory protein